MIKTGSRRFSGDLSSPGFAGSKSASGYWLNLLRMSPSSQVCSLYVTAGDEINLEDAHLTTDMVDNLAALVKQKDFPAGVTLNLHKAKIPSATALLEALVDMDKPSLCELDLGGLRVVNSQGSFELQDWHVGQLEKILSIHSDLSCLDLSGQDLGSRQEALDGLLEAVGKSANLRRLSLNDCNIGSGDLAKISKALSSCNVFEINISSNKIGDDEYRKFFLDFCTASGQASSVPRSAYELTGESGESRVGPLFLDDVSQMEPILLMLKKDRKIDLDGKQLNKLQVSNLVKVMLHRQCPERLKLILRDASLPSLTPVLTAVGMSERINNIDLHGVRILKRDKKYQLQGSHIKQVAALVTAGGITVLDLGAQRLFCSGKLKPAEQDMHTSSQELLAAIRRSGRLMVRLDGRGLSPQNLTNIGAELFKSDEPLTGDNIMEIQIDFDSFALSLLSNRNLTRPHRNWGTRNGFALNLESCTLDDAGCQIVSTILNNFECPGGIALSLAGANVSDMASILQAAGRGALIGLDLSNVKHASDFNIDVAKYIKQIVDVVQKNPDMTRLALGGWVPGSGRGIEGKPQDAFNELVTTIALHEKIRLLKISDCGLTDEDVNSISTRIFSSERVASRKCGALLKDLDLSGNQFSVSAAEHLLMKIREPFRARQRAQMSGFSIGISPIGMSGMGISPVSPARVPSNVGTGGSNEIPFSLESINLSGSNVKSSASVVDEAQKLLKDIPSLKVVEPFVKENKG